MLLTRGQDTFRERGLRGGAARPSVAGRSAGPGVGSPPATASRPQGPGDAARGSGESEDSRDRVPLDSGGCGLQVGGLCGVPGRRAQESGKGPGAAWDGESRPESSTFSGDEEEKGEGLEVKPRLLEPVKSSWSKADSRGGPKRVLEASSSDCSFSVQLPALGADRGLCGFPAASPTREGPPSEPSCHPACSRLHRPGGQGSGPPSRWPERPGQAERALDLCCAVSRFWLLSQKPLLGLS